MTNNVDKVNEAGRLFQQLEQIEEKVTELAEAAPAIDLEALEEERKRELAKEIDLIGSEEMAQRTIGHLDNRDFQQVENFLVEEDNLSQNEVSEVIKTYITERLDESLELIASQKATFQTIASQIEKHRERVKEYDHNDPEDIILIIGGQLEMLDKEKIRKSQKKAEQAKRCMDNYGVTVTDDIRNPEEIVEDIWELDREIQSVQEELENYLGMSRKKILEEYKKRKEEHPYM